MLMEVFDAPNDYIAMQLMGIVALVLHFTKLFGVRKLSQNNTPADRDGVIAGQPRDNPALAQVLARRTADEENIGKRSYICRRSEHLLHNPTVFFASLRLW